MQLVFVPSIIHTFEMANDIYRELLHEHLSSSCSSSSSSFISETIILSDTEARWDELMEARAHFVLESQRLFHTNPSLFRSHPNPKAKCTHECKLIEYKNTFTCLTRGNVHTCTKHECDRIDMNHEYACELTSRTHGVVMDYQKTREQSNIVDHNKERTSMGDSVLDIHVHSFSFSKPKSKRKRKRRVETELPIIESTVDSILSNAMPLLIPHRELIINGCYDTWINIVVASEHYRARPGSYTLPYHCVMVIYDLCKDGLVLVPPCQYVIMKPLPGVPAKAWTSTRKLTEIRIDPKRKQLFASATYTRTEKFFLECANEVLEKLLHAENNAEKFIVQVRQLNMCQIVKESDMTQEVFLAAHPTAKTCMRAGMLDQFKQMLREKGSSLSHIHIRCRLAENDIANTALYDVTVVVVTHS